MLHCITGQNFKQVSPHFKGLHPKTAQKQPRVVASADMKTFEISKLQIRHK